MIVTFCWDVLKSLAGLGGLEEDPGIVWLLLLEVLGFKAFRYLYNNQQTPRLLFEGNHIQSTTHRDRLASSFPCGKYPLPYRCMAVR
jgi:hypothetical protein